MKRLILALFLLAGSGIMQAAYSTGTVKASGIICATGLCQDAQKYPYGVHK